MFLEVFIGLALMSLLMFLMILIWNVRGAAGKDLWHAVKELKIRHKIKIVVLVETRCSGDSAQRAIKGMGFKFQIIEEARGMSGGIWMLWNEEAISLTVLESHRQFIHCRVRGLGQRAWLFTAIYGSPRERERLFFGMP